MEKLDIMVQLANPKNAEKLLLEFKEYASEIDVNFVRKSVLAIGRVAIKIDKAAEKALRVLVDLIKTKINYVVQEAIIVTKDIFRKYPNRYESVISTLCENLESLDEAEAKASMIWIIGEYADRIDNSPELLDSFVETFEEEDSPVQFQLLTAVVKLFLKRPDSAKDMVTNILNKATTNTENPDLRDRGYIYWRLLSTDPDAAQAVVLAKRPTISDESGRIDPTVLSKLLPQIASLASVYHKPPEYFLKDGKESVTFTMATEESDSEDSSSDSDSEEESEDSEDSEDEIPKKKTKAKASKAKKPSADGSEAAVKPATDLMDLLNLDAVGSGPAPAATSSPMDFFGMDATPAPAPASEKKVILNSTNGKGLQISCDYSRSNNTPSMNLKFENHAQTPINNIAIKFNANYLGIAPAGPIRCGVISPGGSAEFSLPLTAKAEMKTVNGDAVQMAVKTDFGVAYFQDNIPAHIFFTEDGKSDKKAFLQLWGSIPQSNERSQELPGIVYKVYFHSWTCSEESNTSMLLLSVDFLQTFIRKHK